MAERTRVTPSPRSFACDLATLCAPTLAGLKPASLFRYQPAPGQDAADMAAAWHAALAPEIGVFLGYPLADVIGFIENRGKNFTACGYWKVYTDPTTAQAEFDRYKKCERIYARCYYNGTPIRRLTVAA